MSCGLPVITTKKADIWRLIEKVGVKIVDHDVNQLAHAMEDIIKMSNEDRVFLGNRAKDWVLTNFDVQNLISIYTKMHLHALQLPYDNQVVKYTCKDNSD